MTLGGLAAIASLGVLAGVVAALAAYALLAGSVWRSPPEEKPPGRRPWRVGPATAALLVGGFVGFHAFGSLLWLEKSVLERAERSRELR